MHRNAYEKLHKHTLYDKHKNTLQSFYLSQSKELLQADNSPSTYNQPTNQPNVSHFMS